MDMRDIKRLQRMNAFLNWNNDEEIVDDLIKIACDIVSKNPKLSSKLSNGLTSIVTSTVEAYEKDLNEHWLGIESAVRTSDLPKRLRDDYKHYICTTIYSVKKLFPEGTANVPYASETTRKYFEEFVNALKDDPSIVESEWAKNYEHTEYLKLVLEKY